MCSVGVVKIKEEQGASAHALHIGHNASLLGCVLKSMFKIQIEFEFAHKQTHSKFEF